MCSVNACEKRVSKEQFSEGHVLVTLGPGSLSLPTVFEDVTKTEDEVVALLLDGDTAMDVEGVAAEPGDGFETWFDIFFGDLLLDGLAAVTTIS